MNHDFSFTDEEAEMIWNAYLRFHPPSDRSFYSESSVSGFHEEILSVLWEHIKPVALGEK